MRVSELIAVLGEAKSQAGDLPVVISRDEEGNGFGTLNAENSFGLDNGLITIWPWEEFADLEDVEGYVPDEEDEDDEG